MRRTHLLALTLLPLVGILAATAFAAPVAKLTVCHKYGTPDEATITVGYPAAMTHIQQHGDWLGACPQFDRYIDVDGISTVGRGLPGGIDVHVGFVLSGWPTALSPEGIDWFDNDGTCTWTMGDDLHLENGGGTCITGIRDGTHDFGSDCIVLDLDGSFFHGQQVDVDLETGNLFTGCPSLDPLLMFYDADGSCTKLG
jgi:hypothetical protein